MLDHITVLESQYVRLATMRSELDDSIKMAIMIAKLKELKELEPYITSISMVKEAGATRRQVCTLFIEEAKHLNRKLDINFQHRDNDPEHLAQATRRVNKNTPTCRYIIYRDTKYFPCDKKGNMARYCHACKRD